MSHTVTFEVDEDLTPVEGVAVLLCLRDGGGTTVTMIGHGDPHQHSVMGMLLGALDEARAQFAGDLELTDDEDERDGEEG